MESMTNVLQAIIDRRAAATPGPAHVVPMTDYAPPVTTWLITGLIREQYGRNAVSFGEDEGTARFVAAAFTDVPVMADALQRAHAHLADLEHALASGEPLDPRLLQLAATGLRNALTMEVNQ